MVILMTHVEIEFKNMKDFVKLLLLFQIQNIISQSFSTRNKKTYSKFNLFHILEFIYLLHCTELAAYLLQKITQKKYWAYLPILSWLTVNYIKYYLAIYRDKHNDYGGKFMIILALYSSTV